jgi:predicted SAM-dependent methyltransferase
VTLRDRVKAALYRLGLDDVARIELVHFVKGLPYAGSDVFFGGREYGADYLHLGCGTHRIDDFLNVDRIRTEATDVVVDMRRRLPLATGSVRGIFHQHALEHIDLAHGARTLMRESFRVLRSDGRLRIGVPDLRSYVDAYLRNDHDFADRLGLGPLRYSAEILNHAFASGHRFLYDYEALEFELRAAGFRDVRRASHRDSSDPMLNQDNPSPGRIAETIFVEARRQ